MKNSVKPIVRFFFFAALFATMSSLISQISHAAPAAPVEPDVAQTAKGIGELDLHYSSESAEIAGSGSSVNRHFKIGVHSGWISTLDQLNSLTFGAGFKTDRGLQSLGEQLSFGIGVFVGWIRGSLAVRLGYTILAEARTATPTNEIEHREGSGFDATVRWITWFNTDESGRRFGFGPSMTYERMKFGKIRVGGLPETDSQRTSESFAPGLTGVFLF